MRFVFLTGYSSSGKSTVARHLVERHGFGYFAFRDMVRAAAEKTGYATITDYLEATDIEQAKRELIDETLPRLAAMSDETILIDGLYAPEYYHAIRAAFPERRSIVLAITSDETLREERMRAREVNEPTALKSRTYLDEYKERLGLSQIIAMADVVITNDETVENLLTKVDKIISTFAFFMPDKD